MALLYLVINNSTNAKLCATDSLKRYAVKICKNAECLLMFLYV